MPAASSINWQGFLEEDRVANFVVLPNYHEDEAIIRDTSKTGAVVYLLPKQLDEQVPKLFFGALWEHELVALIGAQVKALVFLRNYGLAKRGRDLLQRVTPSPTASLLRWLRCNRAGFRPVRTGALVHC